MSKSIVEIRSIATELIKDPIVAINLEDLLQERNIHYRESYIGIDNCGKEILGACKSQGLKKMIVSSPNIKYPARKRFTVAHEMGHLLLHHGNKICNATDFDRWDDKHIKESEANWFAAELLLPYSAVICEIKRSDLNFSFVEKLAQQYQTSLSATAIRLAKLDTGMSAVVVHDGEKIIQVVRSPMCRDDIETVRVDPRSLFLKAQKVKQPVKKAVDPAIWFSDDSDGWICEEETKFFPQRQQYLSIINIYEQ